MGCGVCAHPQCKCSKYAEGPCCSYQGKSRGIQNIRHSESDESVRTDLSHQQHENRCRPREEDCPTHRDASARENDRASESHARAQGEKQNPETSVSKRFPPKHFGCRAAAHFSIVGSPVLFPQACRVTRQACY